MANPEDFGQTIQGLHEEGDSVVADQFHIGLLGKDSGALYQLLRLYAEGDASGIGAGVLPGRDVSGNMHYLKTTADGEVIVNIGAEDTAYVRGTASLVKDTPATVVTESPGSTTKYVGVVVSGAGLCEWTVFFGVTASETEQFDLQTTPSSPTFYFPFPAPLEVASGETIYVEGTNREKGASPGSDFTGRASLVKEN